MQWNVSVFCHVSTVMSLFRSIVLVCISARLLDTGFTSCTKTCGGGRQMRMIKINRREYLQTRRCNAHPCPSKSSVFCWPWAFDSDIHACKCHLAAYRDWTSSIWLRTYCTYCIHWGQLTKLFDSNTVLTALNRYNCPDYVHAMHDVMVELVFSIQVFSHAWFSRLKQKNSFQKLWNYNRWFWGNQAQFKPTKPTNHLHLVNGGYSEYGPYTECSVTCGEGVKYRRRTCTHPRPQFNGKSCRSLGSSIESKPCYGDPCFKTDSDRMKPSREKMKKIYRE